MKYTLEKLMTCFLIGCIFLLGGCQGKEEVVEEEQLSIVTNDVYEAPKNPTQPQIRVFNELSDALKNGAQDEKIAELVAVNFAYNFFTLKQKTGKEDVGGLMFLPPEETEAFTAFAQYKYYNNYATVVAQYGSEALPNISMHETKKVTPSKLNYQGLVYDGYIVELSVKYDDSALPQDALKTGMQIQVIPYENAYRVIACEDLASDDTANSDTTDGAQENAE